VLYRTLRDLRPIQQGEKRSIVVNHRVAVTFGRKPVLVKHGGCAYHLGGSSFKVGEWYPDSDEEPSICQAVRFDIHS
jgi:hypothetical protein